jgi:hypothetical protein
MSRCLLAIALVLGLAQLPAVADVVQLTPAKDNTLVQQPNPASQLSNGQGDVFVGRTNQDGQGSATISIRRGLMQFDIANSGIPAGSTITGVTLTVRDVMGLNGDRATALHRVLADWGEGGSFQNGGMGAPAQHNDATWLYRLYNSADPGASPAWATPGGDFDPLASASTVISDDLGGNQLFAWSSASDPQLIADVQFWLDHPASDFGWLVHGDESAGQTAKRLNSGEATVPPVLEITYHVPEPSGLALAGLGLCMGGAPWLLRRGRRVVAAYPQS